MAITYGMSVKEFWEDDPDLFWAYRFSYYTKQQEEQEIKNYDAWLQGLYFYEGVSVSLNNAFNKQKIKYSSKPYGFDKEKGQDDVKTQQEILMAKIKERTKQVQAIKGKQNSSTTEKGNTEGGEKIDER